MHLFQIYGMLCPSRAEAPKRKARRMFKKLTKKEKAMLVGIADSYGAEAAKAMADLILTTKKVQSNLKKAEAK